jgi:hypothetical protein
VTDEFPRSRKPNTEPDAMTLPALDDDGAAAVELPAELVDQALIELDRAAAERRERGAVEWRERYPDVDPQNAALVELVRRQAVRRVADWRARHPFNDRGADW